MIGPFSIAKVEEHLPAEFVESSSVIKSCESIDDIPFSAGAGGLDFGVGKLSKSQTVFSNEIRNQFVNNDGLNGGLEFWAEFTGVGSEEEFFVRKNFIRFALLRIS